MDLISYNSRHTQYNNILVEIFNNNKNLHETNKIFNNEGKLIICLIEFRQMEEIKYVIYSILSVYKSLEIGLAFVYGTGNAKYIENTFKDFKNVKYIKYDYDNVTRGIYSAILKTPEFYENFLNWSHVLIYQTDALIFRKIDNIYFNYDYIGAPWLESNQWCKFNAGNGGFSLRNVKKCIAVCEVNRNKNIMTNMHKGNEDGFFCSQISFNYPPINSDLHKAFSVERVKYDKPIGCHQIYHNHSMNDIEWGNFFRYMKSCLVNKEEPSINLSKLVEEAQLDKYKCKLTKTVNYSPGYVESLIKINENLKVKTSVGPFTLELTNEKQNRWEIVCSRNYNILFCSNMDYNTAVERHSVDSSITSILHKKDKGVYYKTSNNKIYIIFSPGFPNGGECWADIKSDSNYNKCTGLPINGAIIVESTLDKNEEIKDVNIPNFRLKTDKNILAFDLFTGVGFYNQLFSLECAIYLASVSNRYLVINIQNPLVACGKPNLKYGTIFKYISKEFEKYLIGYEIREYNNYVQPKNSELILPNKISNCIFVDDSVKLNENEIKEFSNGREIVRWITYKKLFDKHEKIIYIARSNASRMFYNFLTSPENYSLMNDIALSLSKFSSELTTISNSILAKIKEKYIGIHLRLGDWHKNIEQNTANVILNDINSWLIKNNVKKLPLYIMADKEYNNIYNILNQWKIVNTNTIINPSEKILLRKKYREPTIAEFLIQKNIIENSEIFIGSQGSTVSVYIQYLNFINNKEYELYTTSQCISFDKVTLKHNRINSNKNYDWTKKNYMGGHPISWSLFFTDNVDKIKSINSNNIEYIESNEINYIKSTTIENIKPTTIENIKSTTIENIKPTTIENINDSCPFMSIDFWIDKCDVFINDNNKFSEINNAHSFKNRIIIGLKTDILHNYLSYLSNLDKEFILITLSNDDHCPPYLDYTKNIDNELKNKINKLLDNNCLIKWFAKNPCIINYKIIPYMLGPKWQWKTTKFFGEDKREHLEIFKKYCMTPERNFYDNKLKSDLLYFNFTLNTTKNPMYIEHKNIRDNIHKRLITRFKWNNNEDFEEYIKTLSRYKFCLAPPGRGIDTHRCWEALMVGTIPIVESSTVNSLYINLPVLIVNDWTNITENYLNKVYSNFKNRKYDFYKLYSYYWYNELLRLVL